VGVGQSEVAVAEMVDLFVLLVPPAAGDGLQGIKRGIMERADVFVVTKADGQLQAAADATVNDLRAALKVIRPRHPTWKPRVLKSSLDPGSAARLIAVIDEFDATTRTSGAKAARRHEQARAAVFGHARAALFERISARREMSELVHELGAHVGSGRMSPRRAGELIAAHVLRALDGEGSRE